MIESLEPRQILSTVTVAAATIALPENSATGATVATVSAHDSTTGRTLTYSIAAGDSVTINGLAKIPFSINSSTGKISVRDSTGLSFQAMPVFHLTVKATDNGTPVASGTAVIQINLQHEISAAPHGLQTIVPLYQYPLSAPNTLNAWWAQVKADANATTPLTVVIDPSNGPINPATGGTDYNNYITGLTLLRQNPNVRILGYIPTAYGADSSASILKEVAKYGAGYKNPSTGASFIDGIFLDEMSSSSANISTYQAISAGIRGTVNLAGTFIVGNPGTTFSNNYTGYLDHKVADVFLAIETTRAAFAAYTAPSYITSPSYSNIGFAAVVHDNPTASLLTTIQTARKQGFDYLFVTDQTGSNPYAVAPAYFNTLVKDVATGNNPPKGTSHTVTLNENKTYTFQMSDFGFTDPYNNPPNTFKAVEITTIPALGKLTDNGIVVKVGQFINAADIKAGKLVFTPAANGYGTNYGNFKFQVQNSGGTANGGLDIDPIAKLMTINVTKTA